MKARTRPAVGIAPLALGLVGVGLITLFVSLGLAAPQTASAAQKSTCRGPASLGGFFRLVDRRKVAAKRTNCAKARKVVKRFPKSCSQAYAAQGWCKVRASGRWRCRSRIAGSLEDGAPSKEKCKRRRSKLRFEVAYFPPTEPARRSRLSLLRGPYDEGRDCLDTSEPGTVIPPPELALGSWEIHLLRGVRRGVGEDLQRQLVARRVSPVLQAGLGSQPVNHPDRVPIFLTRGYFDSGRNWGVHTPTCENRFLAGVVVTARQPAAQLPVTAAHELFHAYSNGLTEGGPSAWWEEAAATWSHGRFGFREDTRYDIALQFPNPLDLSRVQVYPYAMSRFVQFLDDRGFIGGPAWPLQREVINGYDDPGATAALADAVKDRASTLGGEVAAFWGDRLRQNPLHGPQLVPTARNANLIRVRPGTREVTAKADRLDANVYDFSLAGDIKRVEFEFDPPADDGSFWGLVKPDESRPFGEGDSVSFCVGGGDEDDLEWPGNFPVAFTNGALGTRTITGTVTVRAQTSTDQCTNPTLNRACRVLDRAGVQEIVGRPGTFDALSDDPGFGDGSHLWTCFYAMDDPLTNPGRNAHLTVVRYRRTRGARQAVRALIDRAGYRTIDIGDAAAIFADPSNTVVAVAVGREYAAVQVPAVLGRRGAIALAKGIARAGE